MGEFYFTFCVAENFIIYEVNYFISRSDISLFCNELLDWLKNDKLSKENRRLKYSQRLLESQNETLRILTDKINLLIDSDKDSIKSFITDRYHHFCYDKKWIDDYSLDCIEKRYKHYTDEGGNTFINDLMKELRALPKQPQRDNEN